MAWFFFSRVAASLIAVGTLLILTRLLAPEDFGRYTLVILCGTIAQQMTFGWISTSIVRFHSAPSFAGRTISMGFGMAGSLGAALLLIATLAYAILPAEWREPFLLAAVFALSAASYELGLAALRVQRRGPVFAMATVGRPIIGLGLAAALVLSGGGYQSAVIAIAIGAIASGVFGIIAAVRRSSVAVPDQEALSAFFRFGQPLAMVSSSSMAFALATQAILAWMVGLEQVAFFAAATALAQRSITMLMVTLGQTTAASVFHAAETEGENKAAETLSRHISVLLLVSVPILLPFVFASDTVAGLLFDSQFADEVATLLPFLAIASFIGGIQAGFLSFAFSMNKKTFVQLAITAGLFCFHCVLSAALIASFGIVGASWSAIGSALVGASIYAAFGRRIFVRCNWIASTVRIAAAALLSAPLFLIADLQDLNLEAIFIIILGFIVLFSSLYFLKYSAIVIFIKNRNI